MADRRGGVNPLNLGINKRSPQNALSQQIGELLRSLGGMRFGNMGRGAVGFPQTRGATHGFDKALRDVEMDLIPTIIHPTQNSSDERILDTFVEEDDLSVSKPLDAQLFFIRTQRNPVFTFTNFTNMSSVMMAHIPHKLGRPPMGFILLQGHFRTIVETASTEYSTLFRHAIVKQMDEQRSATNNFANENEFYISMDFIPSRTAATGVVPFPQTFSRLVGTLLLF